MKMSILLLAILLVAGCTTTASWFKPSTNETITPEQHQQLPPEQQAEYVPVEVSTISPEAKAKGDAAAVVAQGVGTAIDPVLPGIGALIAALVAVWQTVSLSKTKNVLDRVKLGAQITADNIEAVVAPATEIFSSFKNKQKASSSNTNAIMPDKIGKVSPTS